MPTPSKTAPLPPPTAFASGRSHVFGVTASLLLHAAMAAVVISAGVSTDFDIQFEIPNEVEFGVADAMTFTEQAAPEPPPEAPPEAGGNESEETEEQGAVDAGRGAPDGGIDSGTPDAGADAHADAGADGGVDADAGTDSGEGEASDLVAEVNLPPGANMALRVDLALVRTATLGREIRALINGFPDVEEVLGGSGVNLVDDVERVLDMSPDGRAERAVVAGRYREGIDIRAVVDQQATTRGESANWRQEGGVPVADWHSPAAIRRVIALTGPRHFVICPPEQLRVVLAMSQNRQERTDGSAAEALLSMEEGAMASFEIENAAATYMRGQPHAPVDLRANVRETAGAVELRAVATYPSETAASEARAYWERQIPGIASSFTRNIEFSHSGQEVRVRVVASISQARLGLMFVQAQIDSWNRPRPAAPGASTEGPTTDMTSSMIGASPPSMTDMEPTTSDMTPVRPAPSRMAEEE